MEVDLPELPRNAFYPTAHFPQLTKMPGGFLRGLVSLVGNFRGAPVADEGAPLEHHNDHCNHAGAEKGHEQNHSEHRIILGRAEALKYQSGQMFLASLEPEGREL